MSETAETAVLEAAAVLSATAPAAVIPWETALPTAPASAPQAIAPGTDNVPPLTPVTTASQPMKTAADTTAEKPEGARLIIASQELVCGNSCHRLLILKGGPKDGNSSNSSALHIGQPSQEYRATAFFWATQY